MSGVGQAGWAINLTLAAVLSAGCAVADEPAATVTPSAGTPVPSSPMAASPTPMAPPPAIGANPTIGEVPEDQWAKIVATGTWRPGCPVGRGQLRRIEVNHYDFDGEIQRGVLVAHSDTAQDLADIFTEMFEAGFPITRIVPAEEYAGDVQRSLEADATSAFNCRRPGQINAPVLLSPHASGRAIDINPYRNPWLDLRCDCWQPSADYATTRTGPGVISLGSLPWRLFTDHGWVWQNIKVPDYMHFDTGYPSRPVQRPTASGSEPLTSPGGQ